VIRITEPGFRRLSAAAFSEIQAATNFSLDLFLHTIDTRFKLVALKAFFKRSQRGSRQSRDSS
jgi:hypothetical protein